MTLPYQLLVALSSNSIEVYRLTVAKKEAEAVCLHTLELPGHSAPIRYSLRHVAVVIHQRRHIDICSS